MAIAKFSELMRRGKPIEIYGDGTARRDFTFVDDIVSGIIAAAEVEFTGHEVFNLGCSEPIALNELVEELEKALGIAAIRKYGPVQPGDVPLTYSDVSKARRMLGWEPRVSLRQGLSAFARSIADGRSQVVFNPARVAV
jgi:UDP-glucuronate 4-epimerase